MGKNRPHVYVVVLLYDCLRSIFGAGFVNPEAPIDVHAADNAINEPEPDAIVLKRQMGEFAANPQPDDLSLIVEVSDTTLHFDLTTKARLYARAEIQEYWVIDITGRRLIVHRNPTAGVWASVTIFGESEPVTPLAAPTSEFRVAQVLPAAD
jgi:Uma2 family endonuclease